MRSAAGWLASALIRADALVDAAEVLRENLTEETPRDTIAGRLLWCAAAELALARGEPACALDQINRLVEATPGACSRPIARLELLRGRALTALGQHEAAIAALTISREDAVWSGARPLLWRIEVERGRVFRARHLPKEENLAFASAQALIAELASGILDEALREQFLSYACGQLPGAPSSPGPKLPAANESPLTERELQVAALLTSGLTNREMGERLFLSEWTIATHVRNILAKLDLTSRAQIAAWAASRGIGPEI